MKATKVLKDQLLTALTETQREVKELELTELRPVGKGFRFRLRLPSDHPMARRSANGRRTPSANWEVHRLFMVNLFDLAPNCKLETALATYKGKESFEDQMGATYYKRVGSLYNPVVFGDL